MTFPPAPDPRPPDPRPDGPRPHDPRAPGLRPPAHQVATRAIWYWTARALAGWVVILAVAITTRILDWPLVGSPAVIPAVVVLAAGHLWVMPRWRYRVHRYELTSDAVCTQSGWWTQEWRVAPMSRIQTVDIEHGPVSRLFGLAKLTVTTASAAGPLQINGLAAAVAARMARDLTAAAGADDAT